MGTPLSTNKGTDPVELPKEHVIPILCLRLDFEVQFLFLDEIKVVRKPALMAAVPCSKPFEVL